MEAKQPAECDGLLIADGVQSGYRCVVTRGSTGHRQAGSGSGGEKSGLYSEEKNMREDV